MNKLLLIPLALLLACAPAFAVDSADVTSTPTASAPDKLGAARDRKSVV